MPAIITKDFRIHNARQFQESFSEAADTYYLAIGRPQAFADNQAFNDEGGYGVIWEVKDTNTGNIYALKKMMC